MLMNDTVISLAVIPQAEMPVYCQLTLPWHG
jgi:hypothetical protein